MSNSRNLLNCFKTGNWNYNLTLKKNQYSCGFKIISDKIMAWKCQKRKRTWSGPTICLSPNNNWDLCTITPAMIFVCNCRQLILFSNFFQFPVPMIDANGLFKRFHNGSSRWWLKYNFLCFKEKGEKNLKHDLVSDDTLPACTWNLSSTLYLRLKICSKFFQLSWKLVGNMEIPPFFQYEQSNMK